MPDAKKERLIERYYRDIDQKELKRIFFKKLGSIPPTMEYVRNLIMNAKLFFRMITDPNFELKEDTKKDFISALLYFIEDRDVIPDWIPMIGLWDDYKLIAYVKEKHREEIDRYFSQVKYFVTNYF